MKTLITLAFTFTLLTAAASSVCGAESSIALSPAGISLKGAAGQRATQSFRLSNLTQVAYTFTIQASDVLVQDGKRKLVPAGETAGSIASLVVMPRNQVSVSPGQDVSVPVTFVMPAGTDIRAVAIFFTGERTEPDAAEKIRTKLALGAVVDFTLSNEIRLEVSEPQITPQTEATNMLVTEELSNVGREPVVAKGIAAILDEQRKLAGKATFEQKRLLPGEHYAIRAEYSGTLPAGKYQVLCTLEYSGKTLTKSVEFVAP